MQLPTKQNPSGKLEYILIKDLPTQYPDVIVMYAVENNRQQELSCTVNDEPAITYALYSDWFDHMRKYFFDHLDMFVKTINF